MSTTCGTCRFGLKDPAFPPNARRCVGAPPTAYKTQRLKQGTILEQNKQPEIEVGLESIDPPVSVDRPSCALYQERVYE